MRIGHEKEITAGKRSAGNEALFKLQQEDGMPFADAIGRVQSLDTDRTAFSARTDIDPAVHTSSNFLYRCPLAYGSIQFTKEEAARTMFLAVKIPGPSPAHEIRLRECLPLESFQKRVLEALGLTS